MARSLLASLANSVPGAVEVAKRDTVGWIKQHAVLADYNLNIYVCTCVVISHFALLYRIFCVDGNHFYTYQFSFKQMKQDWSYIPYSIPNWLRVLPTCQWKYHSGHWQGCSCNWSRKLRDQSWRCYVKRKQKSAFTDPGKVVRLSMWRIAADLSGYHDGMIRPHCQNLQKYG